MQFLMLVYTDEALLEKLPAAEFDAMMRGCLEHADELRGEGRLLDSQQLEPPSTARTVRARGGRTIVLDGPFAETKEVLAGFNVLEADSLEDAVRIASAFPWVETGSIELRPIRDLGAVRLRVAAAPPSP